MMDYRELSKEEHTLIRNLCELAMGGDQEALENIIDITGEEIKNIGDIYKISGKVFEEMSQSEKNKEYNNIKQRLAVIPPVKAKVDWGGTRFGAGRPAVEDRRIPRSIKFSDEEWEEIKAKAKAAGTSASEYIRQKTLEV